MRYKYYNKADLYFPDYVWSAKYNNNDPRITGEPDNNLLERIEGMEMLYFINTCAEKWNWQVYKPTCKKLEKLIRLYVPANIHSQEKIKEWIEQNHKKYWSIL